VPSGVRETTWSRHSFFGITISIMPWAMDPESPLSINCDLRALKGDMLVSDRFPEGLGEDRRNVIAREVSRTEDGYVFLTSPRSVEQPLGSDEGDVRLAQ